MRSNQQQPFQDQQETNVICTTLTPEEVQIALSYLKRRFSNYPLDLVVSTIDHYIHQKPSILRSRTHTQAPIQPNFKRNSTKLTQPDNNEGIMNALAKDEKRKKSQQNLKVIAALYCQQGYDYHKANRLIPEITQSTYRNALVCIVNTAFNELLVCLKDQSKIQLQVTPFQKSLIRQQLLYSHRWMGMMSVSALTTFFKLIEKKFQKVKVHLTDGELIELYSIIAKRLTDKNINLSQIEAPTIVFGKQGQTKRTTCPNETVFSEQDLMSLAKCYLRQKSIIKTMEALQLQGKKWNCKQVEGGIHLIIKKSIHKLTNKIIRIEEALRQILESDFDQNLHQSIMAKGENDLKIQLVKYYTVRKPTKQNSEQLVSLVYAFVRAQTPQHQQTENIYHPEIQYQRNFGVDDHEWDEAEQIKQFSIQKNKEQVGEEDEEDIQWLIE